MPTKNKRITVTLTKSNAEFLLRACSVMGKSQSSVVSDILTESADALSPVLDELERAKKGDISKSKLMANMLRITTKTTSDAQIDLLDRFIDADG